MTVTIIGTGLIGSSLAHRLRETGFANRLIGVDTDAAHLQKAIELGWIDEAMPLAAAVTLSQLVIVAIPVDATLRLLPELMNRAGQAVIMDVGSTKKMICRALEDHPRRGRFVATHPMWGTEKEGPEAVVRDAFKNRVAVICESERSDPDALQLVRQLYKTIGMSLVDMEADIHDRHAAYVSHISHVASYALSLTVLEKEKKEATTIKKEKLAKDKMLKEISSKETTLKKELDKKKGEREKLNAAIERVINEQLRLAREKASASASSSTGNTKRDKKEAKHDDASIKLAAEFSQNKNKLP